MSQTIKKKAFWLEQNRDWERSGLGQHEFCEQRGLGYRQFVYWRGRLNAKSVESTAPKLMKVLMIPESALAPVINDPSSSLEVVLPTGIKLHIKTDADIAKAGALIQLLGGAR